MKEAIKNAARIAAQFRVTDGSKFRLKDFDPAYTLGFKRKQKRQARAMLSTGVEMLADLQERLYAENRWSLLIVFQGMDASGKDGAIKHVMSGINPQGCDVFSFKAPSTEELQHDYLWRCEKNLPGAGEIGIFNRSYYEETLVVRVHPELLKRQKLPPGFITRDIWKDRFQDFRSFERYLARNGIVICKFFLHISKEEQRRRFLKRLDTPAKNWKFSSSDLQERRFWKKYRKAYSEIIKNTSTKAAPWYVVPADKKWFARVVVASVIIDTLASMGLAFPKLDAKKRREIGAARRALLNG